MDLGSLFSHELTLSQRLGVLGAFVFLGLVICVQISQLWEEDPVRWTRFNQETKPFWFTLYVLEAFLLVQSAYPFILKNMATSGFAPGYEEKLLNGIWMGLLGLETLMVLGVVAQGVARRMKAPPKQKTI